MNETIIKFILANVFNKLAGSAPAFIDLYGFKTAEIKMSGLPISIGVGLYGPSSTMKIFYINNQYSEGDSKRFRPILTISYGKTNEEEYVWRVEFTDETVITSQVGNFELMAHNMKTVYYIMQIIKDEEKLVMKQ